MNKYKGWKWYGWLGVIRCQTPFCIVSMPIGNKTPEQAIQRIATLINEEWASLAKG